MSKFTYTTKSDPSVEKTIWGVTSVIQTDRKDEYFVSCDGITITISDVDFFMVS